MNIPTTAAPSAPELLAQQLIIRVFTRLMRIRVATQEGHQKHMTLGILGAAFDDELSAHASQVPVNGVMTPDGIALREVFNSIRDDLLCEVGSGLTSAEIAQLDPK